MQQSPNVVPRQSGPGKRHGKDSFQAVTTPLPDEIANWLAARYRVGMAYGSTRTAGPHWDQRGRRDALGSNWQ